MSKIKSDKVSITKSITIQMLGTLLSRISGLIRDVATAHFLGATVMSDAFFAAFRIPNFARKLIGEGPLSMSFVPVFIEDYFKEKNVALRFAGKALVMILICTIAIGIAMTIFMNEFLSLIVPGLKSKPEAFHLAVQLARIQMPFMTLTCLVAIFGAITNSVRSFFAFSIIPLILNASMTTCLILMGDYFSNRAYALAIGVVIGGTLQLILMIIVTKKLNVFPIFNNLNSKSVSVANSKFVARLAPMLFGQGIFQVNTFIDGIFASMSTKTQSYLYYSDRLSQFAITIVGHTLGVVSLPMISSYLARKQTDEALKIQNSCISWSFIWSIPAAVCLCILAPQVIQIIYERGQFNSTDTYYVGNMLRIACIMIPIMSINKIYYASIYSLENAIKTSVVIGIVAVFINFSVNMILMNHITHYYVIISTVISCFAESIMLTFILKNKYNFLSLGKESIKTFTKAALISLLTGLICHFGYIQLSKVCGILSLCIIIPFCIIFYIIVADFFKMISYKMALKMIFSKFIKIKS